MKRPEPQVHLVHCDVYDPERIRKAVRDVMTELDLRPRGRTLLKPNIVASGELFTHAYTRPEVVEGVLGALKDRESPSDRMTELAVGERCGITVPTRFAFEEANYNPMLARAGAKRYCFEEVPQVEVRYTHEGRLRDYVFTPEPVAKADFFVNCPKFKAHPWTTVTFSMKNYIGIQDDRHRLIDHDHALGRKVADLQYIIQPQLVVIDCIIAGEGRMLTPIPRAMNLLVIGNNQLAIDSVGCHILGLDPLSVEHLRIAYERGFGPVALDKIKLRGDVTIEDAKARARGFQVGLVKIDKYFEGTNIKAYGGKPPKDAHEDYCWGGCPGVMEEVIEILRLVDEQCDAKLPKVHLVFGKYDGPLELSYGEKVIFVGDCVQFEGKIGGELVQIGTKYKDRATLDPYTIEHKDIYARMIRVTKKLRELKKRSYTRLDGCPVGIGELVLMIAELSGMQNPYFDKRMAVGFNKAYLAWRTAAAMKRLMGKPYQVPGKAVLGEARPVLPWDEASPEPGE